MEASLNKLDIASIFTNFSMKKSNYKKSDLFVLISHMLRFIFCSLSDPTIALFV